MTSHQALPRTYDLILYGATGFTGRQCARYLKQHAPSGLRWALAGRNREKLDALCQELERPWLFADANDPSSIDQMCAQTRVLLSTAGPFAIYSEPVVEACVVHHTHYVDITGETPWIKSLIDRFHERAKTSSIVILPACGFDSTPSDLGVWLLRERGTELGEIDAAFTLKGGLNGGTIASALNIASSGQGRSISKRTLLCPENHSLATQPRDPRAVKWDDIRERWLIPFFMGPVNTRIVRRSAALLGYGERFTYQEWMKVTSGFKARLTLGALAAFNSGLKSKWGRGLIRLFSPRPGHGPSEDAIREGFVKVHFVNRMDGLVRDSLSLVIDGDPGNKVTCESVCEAALALAAHEQGDASGVLTPMSALGAALWTRLSGRGWQLKSHRGSVEAEEMSEET